MEWLGSQLLQAVVQFGLTTIMAIWLSYWAKKRSEWPLPVILALGIVVLAALMFITGQVITRFVHKDPKDSLVTWFHQSRIIISDIPTTEGEVFHIGVTAPGPFIFDVREFKAEPHILVLTTGINIWHRIDKIAFEKLSPNQRAQFLSKIERELLRTNIEYDMREEILKKGFIYLRHVLPFDDSVTRADLLTHIFYLERAARLTIELLRDLDSKLVP